MDFKHIKIMEDAAIKVGKELLKDQSYLDGLEKMPKKDGSVFTDLDEKIENDLKEYLLKHYPDYGFICEKSGCVNEDREYVWIIDPIDGTNNFLNGSKGFSVCIALQKRNKTIAAVVYFPRLKELYFASEDKHGAYLKHLDKHETLLLNANRSINFSGSMISLGNMKNRLSENLEIIKNFIINKAKFRSLGTSSLSLIKVAKGNFGAYVVNSTPIWDACPAGYIALKAGAQAYTFSGERIVNFQDVDLFEEGLIVANKYIAEEVLECIKMSRHEKQHCSTEDGCVILSSGIEISNPYVCGVVQKTSPIIKKVTSKTKTVAKAVYYKSKPYVKKGYGKAKEYSIIIYKQIKPFSKKVFKMIKKVYVK